MWCASRRPPLGVRLFLSLFAVSRRFSLQPSCHLAVVPLSSFFPKNRPLKRKKERKQTTQERDGTRMGRHAATTHRDFKGRCVVR